MPSNVYIYSQPIQTGKTSRLVKWAAHNPKVGGILTPDIDGRRKLYSLANQTVCDFELSETDEGIRIGRFVFDANTFAKARQLLLHDTLQPFEWVIVDEIGRLELDRNEGLEPALSQIIQQQLKHPIKTKLLLVIRDYLLDQAIAKYRLQDAVILGNTFFELPQMPLKGLVLCGGQSVRMGKDKAMITYHELPQYAHVAQMLKSFCSDVMLSCNVQQKELFNQYYKLIEDNATFLNAGPMTGLLSAFQLHSDTGLLVVGCDYPYFTKADMKALMDTRDEQTDAVCYHNEASGFDEPLLAIYEKQCAPLLLKFYQNGQTSLQQFLKTIRTKRIVATNPQSLVSVDR
ncbi:MAG: NTP transferase domain-containing protein [Bacteroidia bacterium]|jgi:molybdopterin-guanine dinucleotide biosynthesis protein A/nucleoside-triphosphatase THEP1|nr:NTP transferase domain-containing protein [Bacteroidia bacterium]